MLCPGKDVAPWSGKYADAFQWLCQATFIDPHYCTATWNRHGAGVPKPECLALTWQEPHGAWEALTEELASGVSLWKAKGV